MTLADLRALVEWMTKGPWRSRRNTQKGYRHIEFDDTGYDTSPLKPKDATGIVALRNVAAELIACAEAGSAIVWDTDDEEGLHYCSKKEAHRLMNALAALDEALRR